MATPNPTRNAYAPAGSESTELTSQLLAMIVGLGQTQVISLAARLSIADRLKNEARTAEQLAREASIPLSNFVRLMRTLVPDGPVRGDR